MTNSSLFQNLLACLVIGYVAFCFLYGQASLKARRAAAATLPRSTPPLDRRELIETALYALRTGLVLLAPLALLSGLLSFSGRERNGVIEASSLFSVPLPRDVTLSFLSSATTVEKGELVARFASEHTQHRLAALQARRKELVSARDALQSSPLPLASDLTFQLQGGEQRLAQAHQRLTELERAIFATRQQLVAANTTWQRTRNELVARLPALEQSAAAETAEHEAAHRARERIETLRGRGFASVSQLDQVTTLETVTKHRLITTKQALESSREAIATLDAGYAETRALLDAQLASLDADGQHIRSDRARARSELISLRPAVSASDSAMKVRRDHEIAAAGARIEELDNEISAIIAQTHVRSPIAGRVIYRNEAPSTLAGALPVLVVAANQGFLLRVDLARDEAAALTRDRRAARELQVLVDDGSARRIASARLVRIDDSGFDPKRVTAVVGVDMPEDMIVRMALKGTLPTGHMRWSPSLYDVARARIEHAFGGWTAPSAHASEDRARPASAELPTPPDASRQRNHAVPL